MRTEYLPFYFAVTSAVSTDCMYIGAPDGTPMNLMRRSSPYLAVLLLLGAATPAQGPSDMRWAGDAEGGAPYVEADPANPSRVVGFDVEIAELIAKGLGRTPQFVEIAFASIDQSVARGDAEIGLSGIEDTPAHRAALAV